VINLKWFYARKVARRLWFKGTLKWHIFIISYKNGLLALILPQGKLLIANP
jgi:hypothetical protein